MEDLTKKLTPKKRKAIEALLTQPDPLKAARSAGASR